MKYISVQFINNYNNGKTFSDVRPTCNKYSHKKYNLVTCDLSKMVDYYVLNFISMIYGQGRGFLHD